jgi:peptidoglycan/xylan/chitin deacetylase (PgdA/CDA1 family)
MQPKLIIKSAVADLLYRTRIYGKKLDEFSADSFFLLMYHRITSPAESGVYLQPGMYVTTPTFEMHLRTLAGVASILPLSDILEIFAGRKKRPGSLPLCAITFDDGWADFYANAFPLLQAMKMPATVFLPTAYIGTDRWFWTDRLAALWPENPSELGRSKDPLMRVLATIRGPLETQIEQAIAAIKPHPAGEIENVLGEMERIGGSASPQGKRVFLSWQEVEEMHDSGLISFGSHTAGHQILTTLNEVEIRNELEISKRRLVDGGVVDKSNVPFCYPNGNYNDKIAGMVKDAGYTMALTTKNGWNKFEADPYTLKRIGMHQDVSSGKSLFLSRLTNIF